MFNTLKTIAAELKRANDLKERDIENKERCNWYYQMTHHPSATVTGPSDPVAYSTYSQRSMSVHSFDDPFKK